MAGPAGRSASRRWYLGLGSNLGDRERLLEEAIRRLDAAPGTQVVATSGLYETDPWGDTDQGPFLNMVVRVRCSLEPMELLEQVKRIERELGRRTRRRWGPREIDIDLLIAGDLRIDSLDLTVPHPLIGERQFVLVPLAELEAGLKLADGSTVSSLITDDGSVRPWREAEALEVPLKEQGES